MEKEREFYCAFDICNRRLREFGFVCEENGNLYCDDCCAERDLQERTERKSRFLWQ